VSDPARIRPALEKLLRRHALTSGESQSLLEDLLAMPPEPPGAFEATAGAVLAALRSKGETPAEVAGLARAMHSLAHRPTLPPGEGPVLDIVGTGGDDAGSYNISTAAALLCAAGGVRVVKHGNRAVSSRSGSADVLAALGVPVPAGPAATAELLAQTGFAFLFAPHHHPATARLAPVRRALGVRTVFNLLGPLTNPARPPFGVLGAYSADAARLMAHALASMPIGRYFVVHSEIDATGWDEPTPAGPFHLFDVTHNQVIEAIVDPAFLSVPRCAPSELRGGDADHNARALRGVFAGQRGAHRDAVLLSAGLGFQACGIEPDLRHGYARAQQTIDSGLAARWLDRLGAVGRSLASGASGAQP
jgi:anthranilate phosphoribosyltransferase